MPPYLKVDFHVHTPHSTCYLDHMAPETHAHTQAQDIVAAASARGLDAIAITDHNSAAGIDALREAAAKNGPLAIIPGLELTTRGGHLLALFPPETPTARLRTLLDALGFKTEQEGDGYHQTGLWLDEVAQRVREHGGLTIAAHIDRQPRGFIASPETLQDKVRIHSSPYLDALEITLPLDRRRWGQGQMPHYRKPYPCLQGSDAHATNELGRRPVYLKVPTLTWDNLCLALKEYPQRIRFPDDLD